MSSIESSPIVTVAICLHDSSRYVEETLESVLAQTFRDFEVLLVDDGSTDGCADRIEARFPDPRLRILRQAHRGLGYARRVSVDHARSDLVAFLDHDDLWLPHKLERQVRAARDRPGAGLIFSDCLFIDSRGAGLGRLSERHDYASFDLEGTHGFRELLLRGCFIDLSTVLARRQALQEAGGFDPRYAYVEDYDLWLRLACRHPLVYLPEPLAKRRIHDEQFTRTHPTVALAEQVDLLRPFASRPTCPANLRKAVGDYLLGQHRECCRRLWEQRRFAAATRVALGMLRFPGRLADFCRHELRLTLLGRLATSLEHAARWGWERARRLVRGPRPTGEAALATTEVWLDGSSLAEPQTGYFNLLVELTRALLRWSGDACAIHVTVPATGVPPLRERLGDEAGRLRIHETSWSPLPWRTVHGLLSQANTGLLLALVSGLVAAAGVGLRSSGLVAVATLLALMLAAGVLDDRVAQVRAVARQPVLPWLARLLRFLCLRASAPWRPFRGTETVEVIVWRGRFRYAGSRKIALVQDLTTRIHPELHTRGNVEEFEDYLAYVLRRADSIATLSENSRKDIIERLHVFPEAVRVMPAHVNPIYLRAQFSRGILGDHGLTRSYLLCVGTTEPRKNVRRLVKAFERLMRDDAGVEPLLVLAGPEGWDEGFARFLVESDAYPRIRTLGFVPVEHLPSLYHFASAVVYPSVYEGFGLPVLEAMCCSGVVVTARLRSLPEELADDLIDFDPYGTEEITAALRRALHLAPEEAAAYRRRCRSRAEALLGRWAAGAPLPGVSRAGTVDRTCA